MSLCFAAFGPEIGPPTVNLTYYLHEIVGGPGTNGTLYAAAGAGLGNASAASVPGWGTFFVFDSPLKEGTSPESKLLGKSTGTATVTTKGGILEGGVQVHSIHMYSNFSTYHNSSITVQGQVDFTGIPPWECIVPGGTGYFRGYRGYAIASLETSAQAPLVLYKWSIYLSK